MTDLLFCDTETTGLDPRVHDVWEVAWAVNDGEIHDEVLVHSLKTADPVALRLNGYASRPNRSRGPMVDVELRELFAGKTIVGANPAFDTAFLFARWGVAPWHYRMIDIESMAIPVLGYDRPKGLLSIATDLRALGQDVPLPDHTAAGDVATLRAAYRALRS